MTKLLTKLFIRNYNNPDDPKVREKYGTLSSFVGIATNFLLALIKLVAGLLANSVAIIADALNNLSVGRTTFAIAHRLSTLRNADKLLVLNRGKVVEYGTHAELLDKKGFYYKLVMAQRMAELAKQD